MFKIVFGEGDLGGGGIVGVIFWSVMSSAVGHSESIRDRMSEPRQLVGKKEGDEGSR